MSTTATIKVNLDAKSSVATMKDLTDAAKRVESQVDRLDQSMKDVNATAKTTNAQFKSVDATFDQVYGDLKPLTARMGEMEDRLYELALAGKQGTKEFESLMKAVGNYRKTQIQTDMAIDAAAMTMSQKLVGATGAAVGGFAVAQGAMAAFGTESEALNQTLVKVQGAIALLQGFRELKESMPALRALFGGIGSVSDASKEATESTNELTNATKGYADAGTEAAAVQKEINSVEQTRANLQSSLLDGTQKRMVLEQQELEMKNQQLEAGYEEQTILENKIKQQQEWYRAAQTSTNITDEQLIQADQQIEANKKELRELTRKNKALNTTTNQLSENVKAGKANVASMNAQGAAMGGLGNAATGATGKVAAFGGAVKTAFTGLAVGLVVAAAIAGIMALYEATQKESEEEEKAAEARKKYTDSLKRQKEETNKAAESIASESSELVGLLYQLKATNAGSKERETLIKLINTQYGTTLKNLSDENAFMAQINGTVREYIALQYNKYKLQKNEEYIQAQLEKQYKAEQKLSANRKEAQELVDAGIRKSVEDALSYREDLRISNAEQKKVIADAQAALDKLGVARNNLVKTDDKLTKGGKVYVDQTKTSTDVTNTNTEAIDAAKTALDNYNTALKTYYDAVEAARQSEVVDPREKELQDLANRYDAMTLMADNVSKTIAKGYIADQKAAGKTVSEDDAAAYAQKTEEAKRINAELVVLQESYQQDINDVNAKYDQEALQKKELLILETQKLALDAAQKEEELVATTEEDKIAIQQNYAQEQFAIQKKILEKERDILLSNTKLTQEERAKIIADTNLKILGLQETATKEAATTIVDAWNDMRNGIEGGQATFFQKLEEALATIAGYAQQVMDIMDNVRSENARREQADSERRYAEEQGLLDSALTDKLISEEQYESDRRELDIRRQNEQRQFEREAWARDKKRRMSAIIMATAEAIAKTFATYLLPAGIPIAAAQGIIGAAQLAVVKRERFTAARGGIVPGQGSGRIDTVDAKLAPGEAVINAQSTAAYLPILNAINQIGGGQPLVATPTSQVTQIAGLMQRETQPLRAYVVAADMTKQQKDDSRRVRNARLFGK